MREARVDCRKRRQRRANGRLADAQVVVVGAFGLLRRRADRPYARPRLPAVERRR